MVVYTQAVGDFTLKSRHTEHTIWNALEWNASIWNTEVRGVLQ
jgi:hypothetical protein